MPYSEEKAAAVRDAIFAYGILLLRCAAILLIPVMLIVVVALLIGLSETGFILLAIPVILLAAYLAARMSILFPIAAFTGYLPAHCLWLLSKGYAWKLFLILSIAPWPFYVALKLIEWAAREASLWVGAALFVPVALLSFISIAVLTYALWMALLHCAVGYYKTLPVLWAKND